MAKAHAEQYGISLKEIDSVIFSKKLLLTTHCSIEFSNDMGKGIIELSPDYKPFRFEFNPIQSNLDLLPLWVAYPTYNSSTMGWRMSSGEVYREKWTNWFLSLSNESQLSYIQKYPEPEEDDLGWAGFYWKHRGK